MLRDQMWEAEQQRSLFREAVNCLPHAEASIEKRCRRALARGRFTSSGRY
jgi:hypothetical protein